MGSPAQFLWLMLVSFATLPAQPSLQFGADGTLQPVTILLKGHGSVVVGSTTNGSEAVYMNEAVSFGGSYPSVFLALERPSDALRNGVDTVSGAAFDSAGNLWVVGSTTSDDFNLVNPIVSGKVPYRQSGFVAELDPTGQIVKFATYLGGQAACQYSCSTYATAVTADQAGNVYVAGATDESDFPTTPGAMLTSGPHIDSTGNEYYYSFVVKISASGNLVYSTYLGTGGQVCQESPPACISGLTVASRVDSMAVDSNGQVTTSESMSQGPGRITRLSADGSRAIWKTDTGIAVGGIPRLLLAQDSIGEVTLFGSSAPLLDPIDARAGDGPATLFIERLSADGTVTNTLNVGGPSADAQPSGIALDAAGNIWLDGTDSSTTGALSGGAGAGADFLLEVDPAAANAISLIRLFRGVVVAGLAIDAAQEKLIPGTNSALLTVPAGYTAATPVLTGFVNAASYAMNTGFYPGALISLVGVGFHGAPETVMIGGVAAPVLYAGPNQINVQVPFEGTVGSVASAALALPSEDITVQSLPTWRSLGIFTTDGVHAAAVNQDGTVNTAANPAPMGSVVTIYGTGAVWPYGMTEGGIPLAPAPLNQEQNGFQLIDFPDGIPEQILYAGAAPGVINGVFQMNVSVPAGVVVTSEGWKVQLQSVGADHPPFASNTVGIYVQ